MVLETVTGPIDTSSLGLTLVHEHMQVSREVVTSQFPHLYDREFMLKTVVARVAKARSLGVTTICDPTVMGIGRDVRFVRDVAEATGMQMVVATGIFTEAELPPYFASRSIDHMVEAFVRDIEVGIQGTDIRAAFLKCATDVAGLTPDVEKVLRATARTHRRTGVPIMTHTDPSNRSGLIQQDIFEDEGVDLSRVIIGHCGDTEDLDYLERIAERGSYLGMDRYGMSDVLPTARRNAVVIKMSRRGYVNQMMLSNDSVSVWDVSISPELAKMREHWHLNYLLEDVVPELVSLGMSGDSVNRILVGNVQTWFEHDGPY